MLRDAIVVVSDEQRNRNRRAVRRLQAWRERYKTVSEAIRASKRRMYDCASLAEQARERITLSVLSDRAAGLMWDRDDIGIELRETAYRYAPKDRLPIKDIAA